MTMVAMKTARMFLILLAWTQAAVAAPQQDRQAIAELVTRFAQDETRSFPGTASIQVDALDPRLNLAACASPEAFIPPGGHLLGRGTVGVRCLRTAEGPGWTVYVPVQVTIRTTLLVARKPLPAEKVITADDIIEQSGEATRPDLFTSSAQVLGKVVKQGVSAGQVLRQDMVRDVFTIRQGQTVQVVVEGKGFKVSTEGQAMNNAAEGQSVQIRTASGRMISGTAGGEGVVRVSP